MEILRLIGQGLSTKLIADKCCISINTVETHRRHLLEKLQVKNSMELIKEASRRYSLD
jgi:two-component system response regulator NreC